MSPAVGSDCWIDLYDRTDQDEVPSWRRGRGPGDQVPYRGAHRERRRTRRAATGSPPIAGVGPRLSRRAEVLDVDSTWKLVNVRMQIALGQIEAVAARKDDVGPLEERALRIAQAGWRAGKRAELVHAVVHGCRWREVRAVAQGHGRAIPTRRSASSPVRRGRN